MTKDEVQSYEIALNGLLPLIDQMLAVGKYGEQWAAVGYKFIDDCLEYVEAQEGKQNANY